MAENPSLNLNENEEALLQRNADLVENLLKENRKLKKTVSRLRKEVRSKNRIIAKLKEGSKKNGDKKQRYKNNKNFKKNR